MSGPSEWAMAQAASYAAVSSAVRAVGVVELAYCLDKAREHGNAERDGDVERSREVLLESARSTALEEAARVCDRTAEHSPGLHTNDGRYGARLCASSIRALKVKS